MPPRVLLLDSDAPLTAALSEALRARIGGEAFDVGVCNRLRELESCPPGRLPQVVVAEILWPGMRPGDVVRQVQRTFPGTAIVGLTSCPAAGGLLEAVRAGALDCLVKPTDGAQVRAAVARAYRQYVLTSPTSEGAVVGKRADVGNGEAETSAAGIGAVMTLEAAMEGPEREIIRAALLRNRFNRNATAAELGVNRTTLYKKMRKHRLDVGELNAPAE